MTLSKRLQCTQDLESSSLTEPRVTHLTESPDHYRSQQVNRVPALRSQSRQSNVTKISNSTSCHYTAQLHPSDLVQLKLKMESISLLSSQVILCTHILQQNIIASWQNEGVL